MIHDSDPKHLTQHSWIARTKSLKWPYEDNDKQNERQISAACWWLSHQKSFLWKKSQHANVWLVSDSSSFISNMFWSCCNLLVNVFQKYFYCIFQIPSIPNFLNQYDIITTDYLRRKQNKCLIDPSCGLDFKIYISNLRDSRGLFNEV